MINLKFIFQIKGFSVIILLLIFTKSAIPIERLIVNGGGASSAKDLFRMWSSLYRYSRAPFKNVEIQYTPWGNDYGNEKLMENINVFGISDVRLSQQELKMYPDLRSIPLIATAIGIAYNLPKVENLVLTREIIVGIFNGTFTSWSDEKILLENVGANLPNTSIITIAKSTTSGTTWTLTSAFSAFNIHWNKTYGAFQYTKDWPETITMYVKGDDVLTTILTVENSIGYLALYEIQDEKISLAQVVNKNNDRVRPNFQTVQNCMDFKNTYFLDNIFDSHNVQAYPLSSFIYLNVNISIKQPVCEAVVELYRFIHWALSEDSAINHITNNYHIPLKSFYLEKIEESFLDKFTCQNQIIKAIANAQIEEEKNKLKDWEVPLTAGSVIAGVAFISLFICLIAQRVIYHKRMSIERWKIPFHDLNFEVLNESYVKTDIDIHDTTKESQLWNFMLKFSEMNLEGSYKGKKIKLTEIEIDIYRKNSRVTEKLNSIMLLNHINVMPFIGITFSPTGQIFYLEEFCTKCSVIRILFKRKYFADIPVSFSIAREICNALMYLHSNKIYLGAFHILQIMVDNRWTIKISQWAFYYMEKIIKNSTKEKNKINSEFNFLNSLKFQGDSESIISDFLDYWIPPELKNFPKFNSSPEKADVYCFGVILCILFSFAKTQKEYKAFLPIENPKLKMFEPYFKSIPMKIIKLINLCCSKDVSTRPNYESIQAALNFNDPMPHMSFFDHIVNHHDKMTLVA